METQWPPHITVACIVEDNQRFLCVEELSQGELVINQPAGHLEPNETLLQAAIRETYEETGWHVQPTHVLGVSRYTAAHTGIIYYRTTFIANAIKHDIHATLDQGITRAVWLTYEELTRNAKRLRSPLVLQNINQYLSGVRYPLSIINEG